MSTLGSYSKLYGVSCTSSNNCVAVGEFDTGESGAPLQTLIELWDGTAWSVVPSPSPGTEWSILNGVSCISSVSCIAVGDYSAEANGGDQALVESWDGSAWSVVPSVDPGSGPNDLNGVSCTNSNNCVAVGGYNNGMSSMTLVEAWDGSAMSVIPSPNPNNSSGGILYGVSCTSSNSCVAVGSTQGTLVESWNGAVWTIASSPASGYLLGVSCTTSTDCVALGYSYNGSTDVTLVESWDGTAWSVTSSLSPSASDTLSGVSCTNLTSCVAVGVSWTAQSTSNTLIEAGYTPFVTASSGTPQSAVIGTKFSKRFIAAVDDGNGNPVVGVTVRFSAVPDGGASGTFANGAATDTATTDSEGFASSSTFTANNVIGSYTVTAAEPEALSPASFSLTNVLPLPFIKKFTPSKGAPGKTVTITGSYLSGASSVTFNGVSATIIKDTSGKITTVLPADATTGAIQVTTAIGTGTSTKVFKVT